MITPRPHQIEGARFLAAREVALLADEPRVGKTGAAIMAADQVGAISILVVTTASGRGVWRKAFDDWSGFDRVVGFGQGERNDVAIVSWSAFANATIHAALLARTWDLLILDESHYAKNYEAKRTRAVFGTPSGADLSLVTALCAKAERTWCLSGTPLPHSPADIFPTLRALDPGRLLAWNGGVDVTDYNDFLHRYCQVRYKQISQFNRVPIIMGGKNEDELRGRLDGFMLRRTQTDIGIQPPVYETMPLVVPDRLRKEADGNADRATILAAAEAGSTRDLDMHLGPLRRITGAIKADAVVKAVDEEFETGLLDKIVLMFWHREVGDTLMDGLKHLGAVRLDGSTRPTDRDEAVSRFLNDPEAMVFLGQILAAGEAIDLSASSEMIFVESSFTPKDMAQAALRITNVNQKRSPRVRVATLAGSIDEALQASLLRLWTAIREVLR